MVNLTLTLPMARLQNYLRTHRRRHGLSQAEVAILLGAASGTKVSRYENFTRTPNALTIFACQIVFNQAASELFAGEYDTVLRAVQQRARRLLKQLSTRPDNQSKRNLRKLELVTRHRRGETKFSAAKLIHAKRNRTAGAGY